MLKLKWFFLNRMPWLWQRHYASLIGKGPRKDRLDDALIMWNYWNASVDASDRYSPMQVIAASQFNILNNGHPFVQEADIG